MNNQHPITPPPELIEEWVSMLEYHPDEKVFTEVARWGADQELEACCLVLDNGEHATSYGCHDGISLRAARRPKPPTLKEQALKALHTSVDLDEFPKQYDTIRRALEALPND